MAPRTALVSSLESDASDMMEVLEAVSARVDNEGHLPPGERSLQGWVAAAVEALSPRDGKHLERVLEVARSACGADLALALRRVDAVTLVELGGTPAQRPRLPPVGDSLFRGVLGAPGCLFFEPEQAEAGWPAALRGAVALVPWESVEERRGAVLFVRRGTQPFSSQERGRLQALSALLASVARESDLERLTAGLRERVDAISHALPYGLIFLDPQEAEAWLNEPAAALLGLRAGKALAHPVARALAALQERAVRTARSWSTCSAKAPRSAATCSGTSSTLTASSPLPACWPARGPRAAGSGPSSTSPRPRARSGCWSSSTSRWSRLAERRTRRPRSRRPPR